MHNPRRQPGESIREMRDEKVLLPVVTLVAFAHGSISTAAGAFVTQTLIGGARHLFMPYYIYQQAIQVNNFPLAAALSIILLVSVLAMVVAFNALGRSSRGFIHG